MGQCDDKLWDPSGIPHFFLQEFADKTKPDIQIESHHTCRNTFVDSMPKIELPK